MEFLGRLAVLTPPPRMPLIRDHGVLAPHAADRVLIVPGPTPPPPASVLPSTRPAPLCFLRRRWATLIARVFLADPEQCPRGGARRQWVAALLTDPSRRVRRTLSTWWVLGPRAVDMPEPALVAALKQEQDPQIHRRMEELLLHVLEARIPQ